ncbi:MAG: hypothetical protein JWO82_1988 [Akkermansiaceae bacterium]|nr:hypothetical protein [Akkermansiaceae bacterium]
MYLHRLLLSSFFATATVATLHAGTKPAAAPEDSAPPSLAAAPSSLITGDIGITLANEYNTRGVIVQDQGVTFQPYLNLSAKFYEGQGLIQSASLLFGLWADVSSNGNVSGPGNPGGKFTEFDYGGGLSVSFAKRWTFSTFLNSWTSPADGYGDGQWINGTLSFNDDGLLAEHFSIKPYLLVLRDLGGDAATGLERSAWYFEPGIRPNYTFFADTATPLNVALLVKAGLGSEFYAGKSVGYVAAGPQLSVPLAFVDPSLGKWTASTGYLYYRLAETLKPSGDDRNESLFTFNLNVNF